MIFLGFQGSSAICHSNKVSAKKDQDIHAQCSVAPISFYSTLT